MPLAMCPTLLEETEEVEGHLQNIVEIIPPLHNDNGDQKQQLEGVTARGIGGIWHLHLLKVMEGILALLLVLLQELLAHGVQVPELQVEVRVEEPVADQRCQHTKSHHSQGEEMDERAGPTAPLPTELPGCCRRRALLHSALLMLSILHS